MLVSVFQALSADLRSVLRSDFEDVVVALLMSPTHFDAHCLRTATKVVYCLCIYVDP